MRVTNIVIEFQSGTVGVCERGDVLEVTVHDAQVRQTPEPHFMIRRTVALALCKALGAALVAPIDLPDPSRESVQILAPSR